MEKLAISVWNGVQHETTGSEVVLEEDTTISTN
uniref:Uncharacterized protein n=1 Tax=Ciona savignyi TaxID=51511 RepID=H2ZDV2_CIOSA